MLRRVQKPDNSDEYKIFPLLLKIILSIKMILLYLLMLFFIQKPLIIISYKEFIYFYFKFVDLCFRLFSEHRNTIF